MPLSDPAYASLVMKMSTEAAVRGTFNKRRGFEQLYYKHHHDRGVKLRAKYRPR